MLEMNDFLQKWGKNGVKSSKIKNAKKNALFALKATKNAKRHFPKNQRHLDPQNVKIWRFRHDLVTLPFG